MKLNPLTSGKLAAALLLPVLLGLSACSPDISLCRTELSGSDLDFASLASSWDEGMPLGNATVGALVWQRDSALRFSLDRIDLWDLRPMEGLPVGEKDFNWVKEHIRDKDYSPVQELFDRPYNVQPAPSKIPGAAMEFPLSGLGEPAGVHLYLDNALCEVSWADGRKMQTFVHASEPVGWFVFEGAPDGLEPRILAPAYHKAGISDASADPVSGQDLERLGYVQGTVSRKGDMLVYHQEGYGDYSYDVAVAWERKGDFLVGAWSVTSSISQDNAEDEVLEALKRGLRHDYAAHLDYWKRYWNQSSINLPDTLLQKQYQAEMYKFASVAREDSYPISLQSVWTADNGSLPPWKGDFHHDLNTQLSYWPAYIGNHLEEGMGYLNTLWAQRDTYRRYTRDYFGTDGMNVPGVCTLTGEPMGGWIQYAMSQTIGAWLAQHFYLHWKYSADREFLENRAYPFLREVAVYMEQQSEIDRHGFRRLEFSSSPEIYDNSLQAWFHDMTNFDLSLMHFLFSAASEMAEALELAEDSAHWAELKAQLPDFDVDADGSLTFAKGFPYNASHRHFSHALAIHPLGMIDWSDGEKAQGIITATLKKIKEHSTDFWTGYSYAWYANMQARAFNGEEAAEALRTFADCFCLRNTFHANGDQSGTGKSKFDYRPFTLEGNFAFASGVQEMLLQSHTGTIRVFPAIPEDWKDVSFTNLRAMGAFLVSAERKGGEVTRLGIYSEKGGRLSVLSPVNGEILEFDTEPGQRIEVL